VLGLLGFGAIAEMIAERARGFGVERWAHDPYKDDAELEAKGVRPVSFDQLVEGSDFLIIQAPLTSSTRAGVRPIRCSGSRARSSPRTRPTTRRRRSPPSGRSRPPRRSGC
jgi:hypothetical protein